MKSRDRFSWVKLDFVLSLTPTPVTTIETGFQLVVEISETVFFPSLFEKSFLPCSKTHVQM